MSWRYQDDTECLSISTADALRYFQFNAAAVAAGRMQYNAAENRSCEIAVLESACEVDLEQDAACVAAFVGTVGEYQGCDSASYECAPGLDCILDDSATSRCGLCKNALAEGQVCSLSEVCAPGFTCEFGDDTNVCVRLATREGESCVPSDFADTCAGTLQCVDGAGSPRCALPSQEGASCDSGSDVDVCDGNKWLICAEDKCQQRAVVGRGERCDNELRVCEYGDTCTEVDPGVFVCRPRVQPGGSCAKSQCARDAFCNDDDVCEAKRAAGASCTRSSQCVGGLSCLNAGGLPSGTRTCRPVEWMECE